VLPCPRCQYDLSETETGRCPECGRAFDRNALITLERRAWPPARAKWVVILAGLLILPFALLSIASGIPELCCPMPALFVYPAFVFGSFTVAYVFGSLVLLASFYIFARRLTKGRPTISSWTVLAVAVLQVLNWLWIAAYFSSGLINQGRSHVVGLILINVAFLVTLAGLWCVCLRRPTFLISLAFHWLAWIWLAVYLFPYLFDYP
jgi:hypothetical protein